MARVKAKNFEGDGKRVHECDEREVWRRDGRQGSPGGPRRTVWLSAPAARRAEPRAGERRGVASDLPFQSAGWPSVKGGQRGLGGGWGRQVRGTRAWSEAVSGVMKRRQSEEVSGSGGGEINRRYLERRKGEWSKFPGR